MFGTDRLVELRLTRKRDFFSWPCLSAVLQSQLSVSRSVPDYSFSSYGSPPNASAPCSFEFQTFD